MELTFGVGGTLQLNRVVWFQNAEALLGEAVDSLDNFFYSLFVESVDSGARPPGFKLQSA